MLILAMLPIICSSLMIAAHFYRADSLLLAAVSLLTLFLLCMRSKWTPRLLTPLLLLAAVEWLRTMMVLIGWYQQVGHPWTRLAIILTGVSLFTALSPLTFRAKAMKWRYHKGDFDPPARL